ncbi:MAG: hypothetical protein V1726_01260 [Methanobacteriota archaeon]
MNKKTRPIILFTIVFVTISMLLTSSPSLSIHPISILQQTSQPEPLTSNPCNHAPTPPDQPSPANNSLVFTLHPTLRIRVTDQDNDTMNVSFYNAKTNALIKKITNVHNGATTETTWTNRSHNTTYTWYVIANDSQTQTRSPTYTFTTYPQPPGTYTLTYLKPRHGIQARITNTGNTTITNLTWNLTITSKRTIHPLTITKHGIITLTTHNETILTVLPKGFGRIQVTLKTASSRETPHTQTTSGFLLRYHIILLPNL